MQCWLSSGLPVSIVIRRPSPLQCPCIVSVHMSRSSLSWRCEVFAERREEPHPQSTLCYLPSCEFPERKWRRLLPWPHPPGPARWRQRPDRLGLAFTSNMLVVICRCQREDTLSPPATQTVCRNYKVCLLMLSFFYCLLFVFYLIFYLILLP